jgi:hypothetical protein
VVLGFTTERMVGAFAPGFHPGLPIVFPFGEFRSAEKSLLKVRSLIPTELSRMDLFHPYLFKELDHRVFANIRGSEHSVMRQRILEAHQLGALDL